MLFFSSPLQCSYYMYLYIYTLVYYIITIYWLFCCSCPYDYGVRCDWSLLKRRDGRDGGMRWRNYYAIFIKVCIILYRAIHQVVSSFTFLVFIYQLISFKYLYHFFLHKERYHLLNRSLYRLTTPHHFYKYCNKPQ